MRRSMMGVWAVVAFPLAAAATEATHPSFPCARAATGVERAICADPTLSGLDLSLESVFRKTLASRRDDRDTLLVSQRRWLADRGTRCGIGAAPATAKQTECLVTLYTARVAELSGGSFDLVLPAKRVKTLRVEPDGTLIRR